METQHIYIDSIIIYSNASPSTSIANRRYISITSNGDHAYVYQKKRQGNSFTERLTIR